MCVFRLDSIPPRELPPDDETVLLYDFSEPPVAGVVRDRSGHGRDATVYGRMHYIDSAPYGVGSLFRPKA